MKKIVITGGTGFLGTSLARHLQSKGYHPVIIARNRPDKNFPFDFVFWDARTTGDWIRTLEDAIAVVNLTGKSVDCIKTPDNCDLILRSRIESTRVIGEALRMLERPPEVWIQMSTAHIYGDPPKVLCTENSATGYGFAPNIGRAWEDAFLQSLPEGMREVRLRTSFVIGKNGGAMKRLKAITRLGLGGKIGSGKQGFSWIHEFDFNEIVLHAILHDSFNGVYVVSSPNPVSQRQFMKALRKKMKMPIGLPAPEWMTRIGAKLLFKTDPELAIYGRYVKSERLEKEGFSFRFPDLENAVDDLV
ncbi:MAG: TIGR01777 family protein [Bacteroidetes bacterium]|nr:TIGR01777 family protein [Bacteroidota bacterium]